MKNKYIFNFHGIKINFFWAFLICSLIFSYTNIFSKEYIDSKGKDFWITYLPNYHTNNLNKDLNDSLYIFIASDVPTKGKIEYTNKLGMNFTTNFEITNVNEIYSFRVHYEMYELFGVNVGGNMKGRFNSENISHLSFHVSSEEEVIVYGHSQGVTTSESFLVFPTDALGNDYYALSYYSSPLVRDISQTPSQFAVVGTEDSTQVTIFPSCNTNFNLDKTVTINLNQGEVYLVQADILSDTLSTNDISGSLIKASKPVAVFCGHQRASIPAINNYVYPSRDCLIEQLPPISTWGKNAFLTPYIQHADIIPDGNDLYRVMAAYDDTEIYLNGNLLEILNAGEYYEDKLINSGEIEASAPILVAQYKKTAKKEKNTKRYSDPFMMVVPPKEQFMDAYKVINVQSYQYNTGDNRFHTVYTDHFITVILPETATGSLLVDGVSPGEVYKEILGTGYVYSHIRVSEGTHNVEAAENFGIQVYGYGYANSYGYVGGMSFKAINYPPPGVFADDECYGLTGKIYDPEFSVARVDRAMVVVGSEINTSVTIKDFTSPADTVFFNASLVDSRLDGEFEIIAHDIDNQSSKEKFEIPGFTIGIDSIELTETLPHHEQNVKVGQEYCFKLILHNYGKFTQPIDKLLLNFTSEFTINKSNKDYLQPGEKETIIICFESENPGEYSDTLKIDNGCSQRLLTSVKIIVEDDTEPPGVNINDDPCMEERVIVFTESSTFDYGIETIEFEDTVNCALDGYIFNPKEIKITLNVIDPFKDSYYQITATDSVGNFVTVADTIQGFTIAFPQFTDSVFAIDYGGREIGSFCPDSIEILNYGILPFVVKAAPVFNILFSVPQSQFPFILAPGESRYLNLVYKPLVDNDISDYDTLRFTHECREIDIELTGIGESILLNSASRCKQPFKLQVSEVPDDFFLDQSYPNPIAEGGIVRIGLPEKSTVAMKIYTMNGVEVREIANAQLDKGIYEFAFNTGNLVQGAYYLTIEAGRYKAARKIIIAR